MEQARVIAHVRYLDHMGARWTWSAVAMVAVLIAGVFIRMQTIAVLAIVLGAFCAGIGMAYANIRDRLAAEIPGLLQEMYGGDKVGG
jgi:hypothetical protein